MTWVMPEACTLPIAEQPFRLDELDRLFANAVREQRRVGDEHLRLVLAGDEETETTTRDLIRRESACCAFFDLAVERLEQCLVVDVRVPSSQTAVLDGLEHRIDQAIKATT